MSYHHRPINYNSDIIKSSSFLVKFIVLFLFLSSFLAGHAVGAAGIFLSWDKNANREITKDEVLELFLHVCFMYIERTSPLCKTTGRTTFLDISPSCVYMIILLSTDGPEPAFVFCILLSVHSFDKNVYFF